jgi:hypothetical protein
MACSIRTDAQSRCGELAAHAERRRDPQFYQTLIGLEREYDAGAVGGLPILSVERVGRAKAREVMSGIAVRDAQMKLHRFSDQREQMTVIVGDDGARGISLARMADVRPRTPVEILFRPLIERGEKYRQNERETFESNSPGTRSAS